MVLNLRKFLLMITFFLCMTPTVFGADRYSYNKSWDDDYLGKENIKQIIEKMGISSETDESLNNIYDSFVKNYATLKQKYPSVNLRNLVFFARYSDPVAYGAGLINVTVSNGTFGNETVPYLKLVYGSSSIDYVNWVSDYNSDGFRADCFAFGKNLSQTWSYVNLSQIFISKIDESDSNSDYKITGKMFSWSPAYTIYYRENRAFLIDSLPGLLIAPGEYLKPDIPSEPENPSGDTPSGDTGGGDYTGQLNKIQENLGNIENKIPTSGEIQGAISQETDKVINFMSGDANFSGENTNISSGDIAGAIGYKPPDDPYANFWLELTKILNDALTSNNRTLILECPKNTYTVSIDDINWNPPESLKTFLTLLSTTCVCLILVKFIKVTIDKLSSGSIDEALSMNEENGIVDLF